MFRHASLTRRPAPSSGASSSGAGLQHAHAHCAPLQFHRGFSPQWSPLSAHPSGLVHLTSRSFGLGLSSFRAQPLQHRVWTSKSLNAHQRSGLGPAQGGSGEAAIHNQVPGVASRPKPLAATNNSSQPLSRTVVSVIERHEGMSATDSMDYADLSEFSSEEEPSPVHTGAQERQSAVSYSYNKSSYEVLRLDASGRTRKLYVRRRDLLKEYRLQPRDLRRIDPSIDFTKTSPSITIKENVLLLCLGGVRAIVTAEKALLFEPGNLATKRLIDTIGPHLRNIKDRNSPLSSSDSDSLPGYLVAAGGPSHGEVSTGGIGMQAIQSQNRQLASASHTEYMARFYAKNEQGVMRSPPFELEVLEGALIGATGRLDAELAGVTGRVQDLLTRLPNDINPVSLEELRRVKAALVELEDKADNLRGMLEELMDDEDELRELNLSSRPRREERRRQRERDRLERELERAREIKEGLEEQLEEEPGSEPGGGSGLRSKKAAGSKNRQPVGGLGLASLQRSILSPAHYVDPTGMGYASWTAGAKPSMMQDSVPSASSADRQKRISELRSKFDRERLADLRAKFSWGSGNGQELAATGAGRELSAARRTTPSVNREREREAERAERMERLERLRAARGNADDGNGDWISRLEQQLEGSEEDIQEAQEALEEMVEAEEEEAEVEEVEDLLEYYLQRTGALQSEAERLLEGARDLEESIGVSLSARRYEVNRLELTLSIGSFAAALGAMIAGIFGMNMKSMLEMSVVSFWGVSGAIVVGCVGVFITIMRYTRQKRIL